MNLSKNDFVQQATAKLTKIFLFVEMCDEYPLVYDIIWGLSFNPEIEQQLRTSSTFMSKLAHLAKQSDNEQMKKTIQGILWNLEIDHDDRPVTEINNGQEFDIMISYSHKDKLLCHQIYEELTKSGYRVWIDFDQMHGNVMDAMAQAIEQSQTVIICMSENYRKSNYCRAEAQYAFQRQRKMVPVLLQKHYKPDGWLSFLLGQSLYTDFNKYEFTRAMTMLYKELKSEPSYEGSVASVPLTDDANTVPTDASTTAASPPTVVMSITGFQTILEWTQEEVSEWLLKHNLVQMSRLLSHCDGRSLVYLNRYIKDCQPQQVLNLLQEDALQRTKQSISLIELSCFHALMDRLKNPSPSMETFREKTPDHSF